MEGENDWIVLFSNGNIIIFVGNLFFFICLIIVEDVLVEGNEYFKVKVVEIVSVFKLCIVVVIINIMIIDIDIFIGMLIVILFELFGFIYVLEIVLIVV